MQTNRFEVPVTVRSGATGDSLVVHTVGDATEFLMNAWPGKRSPKHRAALQACHDATSGAKPVMHARRAFVAAAREVSVLTGER